MKTVRIIYNIFSAVLIAAIVLITLLAVLLGVSGMDKKNPKSILGFRAFIVQSPSMTPTFDAGSLLIIKETAADKLKVDDIITYKPNINDETLLTHRIVRIDGDGGQISITTRGDANNIDDNPTYPGAVLGRAVFYMDGFGTFIVNLRTPMGILGMIAIIGAGLFFIPWLLTFPGANKKTKDINNLINDIDTNEEDTDIAIDEDEIETGGDDLTKYDDDD